MAPANVVCWFEIPVLNLKKSAEFYNAVLKTEMKHEIMGPNPTYVFPTATSEGVSGHIYEGKPPAKGTGPTVSFVAPDTVEKSMERVKTAGGEVVSPVIEIPFGRFAYCLDLDGNSFSVFEFAK
jgi:predicted enzyme related to lactoylglutathione lyase